MLHFALTRPPVKVVFSSFVDPIRWSSFHNRHRAKLFSIPNCLPRIASFNTRIQPGFISWNTSTRTLPLQSSLQLNEDGIAPDFSRRPVTFSSFSPDTSDSIPIDSQYLDDIERLRDQYRDLSTGESTRFGKISKLIEQQFPFELDGFQKYALRALCSNSSVVLSAPTGAGKTVIGEMAVFLALCRQLRVFYTTPLKALSNQKFYDFKQRLGASRVGLLTGDLTINRDADVIVMTTEVYRNMLYSEATERSDGPQPTDGLFAVIFDEFHYLNDQDRGTVWEESVINSPSHVLLVALSATMSNATDVRDWFFDVQGQTTLVQSSVRPVPLNFGYCDQEGLTPLFANEIDSADIKADKGFGRREKKTKDKKAEPKMHPKLLRKLKLSDNRDRLLKSSRNREDLPNDKEIERLRNIARRSNRRDAFARIPSFPFVVRTLRKKDMLPCIVFIFSRAGCDRAAMATGQERGDLVTKKEKDSIQNRLNAFMSENPEMVQKDRLELAKKGIASHHAGLLPLWKLCIEELFQDGLIKVVFATETLAAGINMPARTTVISALSKRAGEEGFRNLTTSEVLQMAGRAGRRGKDIVGHSLVLRSRNEGAFEAFKVLTRDVDALESKFTPTYGMVLNLLLTRPLSEAKRLVDRSFGNFLRQKQARQEDMRERLNGGNVNIDIQTLRREKAALLSVLQEGRDIISTADDTELRVFIKSLERVKAEKRALSYLIQQNVEMGTDDIQDTLTFAPVGTRLLLRERTGISAGAEKRQKRRDYAAAIGAAGEGDSGAELRSFYLSPNEEELEEMDEEELEESVIEAIFLDLQSEPSGAVPIFVAIDANGHLRLFNHSAVVKILYDDEAIDIDAVAPNWTDVTLPDRSLWRSVSYDQYVAPLPTELDPVVACVQSWRAERASSNTANGGVNVQNKRYASFEVQAQRARIEEAKQAVRAMALFKREDIGTVLAARRAIARIEATLDGSFDPMERKRRRRRSHGSAKRYAQLEGESDESEPYTESSVESALGNSSWEEFMNLVGVLQHYGFIDTDYKVTSLGEMGAKVRGDNELWTSVTLLEPDLAIISPVHLGAVIGATQMEGGRGDAFVDHDLSDEVRDQVERLGSVRTRMIAVQTEFGVEVPVALDAELVSLVELWSSGVNWVELLRATSLQEGDVCRIIRRTLDVLRQVQHLPIVSSELKRNARRAVALLDRFPVTDDRTYWINENEKASGEKM